MTEFFDEQTEASEVKATIIEKYFKAWATIMLRKSRSNKLGYIDLFSGPGRYRDNNKSTPLKVLEYCIQNEELRSKIVAGFNDANPDYAEKLRAEIEALPGIELLKHKPFVRNYEVGDELTNMFVGMNMVPSLSFIDPWGYKGVSQKLIRALIKDWGSDCIFFFNYSRINAAITNPLVVEHINAIFGETKAAELRARVATLRPDEREQVIMNEIAEVLSNNGANYVLPFRFVNKTGSKTSHYLIFVSKNPVGYKIMKDIMHHCSSQLDDGVACFSYIPVTNAQLSLLFSYSRPLDELGSDLLKTFAGKRITVIDIFNTHNVGTPYVLSNYKEALKRLEAEKKISVIAPPGRRKNTMPDTVTIVFPRS